MLSFEAWCRPHGRAKANAHFSFIVQAIDTRAARQTAMKTCFYGADVRLMGGGEMRIEPLVWTVCRVKPLEQDIKLRDESKSDNWPRPGEEFASSATHDAAVARLYGGRRYDSYQIRPSRSVLDFRQASRVVNFDHSSASITPGQDADRTEAVPQAAVWPRPKSKSGGCMALSSAQ